MTLEDSTGNLRTRLYWLMGLRVVVVTLLLGLSIAIHTTKGELVNFFYALITATYAVTIGYAAIDRYLESRWALTMFAHVQIGIDLLLETVLVTMTGAVESPFSVLYVITVCLASLVPRHRIGVATGAAAVFLFGAVAGVQLSGILESLEWLPRTRLSLPETLQIFGVHGLAFVLVGFLSGVLADQLRHADESLLEKERGLTNLQAFHENIVQSIGSGVFTTDESGLITSFNRAAQEATGYSFDQVYGRAWGDIFNCQGGGAIEEVRPGGGDRFEVECKRADGSRLVLGITLSALEENGAQTGLVGVFKDLTQIRDMEEEMRRRQWLATLGEMSAGMAHEIRNPLGALVGAMQMLRKDAPIEDTNRHLMDIAIREATRLDAIIKEFLQYARPPALNLKECDLNVLIKESVALIQHEARKRGGVEIKITLHKGALVAKVDPDQLKQVFWNLATNAFQAMPHGGELTIASNRRRIGIGGQKGEVIEITFQDSGEGIKKEHLDKIFLPFFTTKREGSGLGLAAIDRIVDLHGGWVRVESQEGQGTLFVICLPKSPSGGPRLWHEGRGPWKRS